MIERMMRPLKVMLETPLQRRASPHGNDHELARKLREAGVSLKEIARTAARAAESRVILLALHQTHWNRVRAAQLLKVSYRTLLYKIKGLGLHPAARTAQRHPGRLGAGQDPKA
jgi:DNA-binding NtrC family response regulator